MNSVPDQSNRTIQDLVTGEQITFLETAEESGRDRLSMEITPPPGGLVNPHAHAHPLQEDFEGLEGQLLFRLGDRSFEFSSGSTLTVPPGRVHGFRNVSQAPASVRIVATPGAYTEYGLRLKVAFFNDGFFTKSGRPTDLLLGAVVLHRAGLYIPPVPVWLYQPLIAVLAAFGRWRGREKSLLARYPDYDRMLKAMPQRTSPTTKTSSAATGS